MTRYPVRPGVPSENGWPMIGRSGCVLITAPGAGRQVPVRAGDVATVLDAFLRDYARLVEPIRSQVWGWSADNDVADSNHMSATAVDVNAPQYPWGLRTMPRERIANLETMAKASIMPANTSPTPGPVFMGWSRSVPVMLMRPPMACATTS